MTTPPSRGRPRTPAAMPGYRNHRVAAPPFHTMLLVQSGKPPSHARLGACPDQRSTRKPDEPEKGHKGGAPHLDPFFRSLSFFSAHLSSSSSRFLPRKQDCCGFVVRTQRVVLGPSQSGEQGGMDKLVCPCSPDRWNYRESTLKRVWAWHPKPGALARRLTLSAWP